MKKEYISQAKNVDKAIEEGLLFLGKTREDVDIKILETGGLFKKAKVALEYEEVEEIKSEEVVENKENNTELKEEILNSIETPIESAKNTDKIEEKVEEKVEKSEIEEVKAVTEEVKEETATTISANETELSTNEEKQEKIVDSSRLESAVKDWLVELLRLSNIEASVDCNKEGNELYFSIIGENVGKLIGYRGETLTALQTLMSGLKIAGEGKIRLFLDIDDYKKKREETIIELANKMADKAEEIERNVHLDPMNPYERRIVHTTLQNRTLVETESMGEGEKRHVVIKFKR